MTQMPPKISSGIEGIDIILGGGYPEGSNVLIEGEPGSGKTTLSLHFLLAGAARGERALYFSVAQSKHELTMIAQSHGFDLSDVIVETPEEEATLSFGGFSVDTREAQFVALMQTVERAIKTREPDLFVFDSLLEMRLLAHSEVTFRSGLLGLLQLLRKNGTTAVLVDHNPPSNGDRHAEGISHGVLRLEGRKPSSRASYRRLFVLKMRGMPFTEGYHDFRIKTGGIEVYPRLVPTHAGTDTLDATLPTRIGTLNRMLGGGLEFGTTCLVAGQSGTGKSTMATVLAASAAEKGHRSALFLFEERTEVFRQRSEGVGLDISGYESDGMIRLDHSDPGEVCAGEFSRRVVAAVEEHGAKVIVIDSLTGYLATLEGQVEIIVHLSELLHYLSRSGVLTIITLAQHGLLGEAPRSDIDSSYFSDSIILLRHYASGSRVRRSIAVLKKRHSEHERQIQELVIKSGAVDVRELSDDAAAAAGTDKQMGVT